MKIYCDGSRTENFGKIRLGDAFLKDGVCYIRVDFKDTLYGCNCINLETGRGSLMAVNEVVSVITEGVIY